MSEHHTTLPPSSFPAFAQCGAFKPSGEKSEYANAGTEEHKMIAQMVCGYDNDANNIDTDPCVDCDQVERVQWAAETIRGLVGDTPLIEHRVELLGDNFEVLTFGTVDYLSRDGQILVDYKSGEIRDYWPQMAVYAAAVMQTSGLSAITCYVVYGKYRRVETRVLTRAEADTTIMDIVQMIELKQPRPCDYCGWCGDRLTCPAMNETALAVVTGYQAPDFASWHPSDVTDPETMGRMLDAAGIVEKWCESVRHHATALAMSGTLPEGYKIQERIGKRTISDLTAAFNASGLSADKFLAACSCTLSKLQEQMGKTKKEFDTFITPLCTSGKPTTSLVKEKK